ncbi:zinc-type alcohol dehydrogenase, GroES-like [Desulfosarcina variabilis str. Montpellier]|uniref:zinc-dependent alcohol dehydrogenase family protein n=1 Tax=Desulfosarcina variabilis TaxID=2300 RepID=UPI003AFB01BF
MKKAVIMPGQTGMGALAIQDMKPRKPGANEVRIKVHAASINYKDIVALTRGVDQELIPLSDGAGVVEEVGPEVNGLKPGDRVVGLFFPLWQSGEIDETKFGCVRGSAGVDGMLAQSVTGHADGFVKFPEYLSYEEAATLPCAAVTAWNALIVNGNLKPGETLLVLGTGGVALFALQLAKKTGARVILLSSSDEKLEMARKLGADGLVNYKKNPDWEKNVLEQTNGQGVDLVLELGGVGTFSKSMAAAKINGRISMVGVLTGTEGAVNPMPIIRKSLSVKGIYVGSRDMQKQLHNYLYVNRINPVIDRVFSFNEIHDAFEFMQKGKHFGKIVLKLDTL